MKQLVSAWIDLVVQRGNPLGRALHSMRSEEKRRKLEPLPNLSAASKCVWQMDREA